MLYNKYRTEIKVYRGLKCVSYHTDRNGWWYNILYGSDYPTGAGFLECDVPALLRENNIPQHLAKTLFFGLKNNYEGEKQ